VVSIGSDVDGVENEMKRPVVARCPHCDAGFKLKSTRQLGRKVACPKCRQPFVIEDRGAGGAVPDGSDDYQGVRSRSRVKQPAQADGAGRGKQVAIIVSLSAVILLTVGGIGAYLLLPDDDDSVEYLSDADNPLPGSEMVPGMPPGAGGAGFGGQVQVPPAGSPPETVAVQRTVAPPESEDPPTSAPPAASLPPIRLGSAVETFESAKASLAHAARTGERASWGSFMDCLTEDSQKDLASMSLFNLTYARTIAQTVIRRMQGRGNLDGERELVNAIDRLILDDKVNPQAFQLFQATILGGRFKNGSPETLPMELAQMRLVANKLLAAVDRKFIHDGAKYIPDPRSFTAAVGELGHRFHLPMLVDTMQLIGADAKVTVRSTNGSSVTFEIAHTRKGNPATESLVITEVDGKWLVDLGEQSVRDYALSAYLPPGTTAGKQPGTLPLVRTPPRPKTKNSDVVAVGDPGHYVAEFGNARFVLLVKDDGNYSFFPLGLDPKIKVDAKGQVSGPVAVGTWKKVGNSLELYPPIGGTTRGEMVKGGLKITAVASPKFKALLGMLFEFHTRDEFLKVARGNQGGSGDFIKTPGEFVHRFLLALDGDNGKIIAKFSYIGLGPNDRITTIKAMPRNPKVLRCWDPRTGKVVPGRALNLMRGAGRIASGMRRHKFDVKTLKVVSVKRQNPDDFHTVVVDGNGTRMDLAFDDVLMTPFGLKMFDAPSAKFTPAK